MGKNEFEYYESMKGDRKMECDLGVDPVWYAAMVRRQRLKGREEKYEGMFHDEESRRDY